MAQQKAKYSGAQTDKHWAAKKDCLVVKKVRWLALQMD